MSNNIKSFEKMLDSLKFKQSVPEHIQRYILDNKKNAFEEILKHFGEYNFVYNLVLKIYYFTKRIGINLSVTQSAIFLGILSFLTAIAIFTGIIISTNLIITDKSLFLREKGIEDVYSRDRKLEDTVVNNLIHPASGGGNISQLLGIDIFTGEMLDDKNIVGLDDFKSERLSVAFSNTNVVGEEEKTDLFEKLDKKQTPVEIRLGITILKASGGNVNEASAITSNIYNRLIVLKGSNRVIYRKIDGSSKSVNRLLIGRLSKLGKDYILAIRVVEGQNGAQLYNKRLIYEEGDNIENYLDSIAKEISNKDEIWKER